MPRAAGFAGGPEPLAQSDAGSNGREHEQAHRHGQPDSVAVIIDHPPHSQRDGQNGSGHQQPADAELRPERPVGAR